MWNKALSDFQKILRSPGLKYQPAILTVYSGFICCLKKILINTGQEQVGQTIMKTIENSNISMLVTTKFPKVT